MKHDTISVLAKGIGLIGAAMASTYLQALGQWSNSGEWPSDLQWHMIIVGTIGSGFTALVAFMSGSYSNWKQVRTNGNGNGETKQ